MPAAGVGAFCTQHYGVKKWGDKALDALAQGNLPEEVLADLLKNDKFPGGRQLGIIDMQGRSAQHHPVAAPKNSRYWGGASGRFYVCQGNTLTGRAVIVAMGKAYEETKGSLADRLMAALLAGDCAGGDHRGRLAAGIRVCKKGVEGYWLDLHVDKSNDAVIELARSYAELKHDAKGDMGRRENALQAPLPGSADTEAAGGGAVVLVPAPAAPADTFDNYTNPILAKVPESKSAEAVKRVTPEMMVQHSRVLPGVTAALVVVKTNDGRLAKLLVRPAAHKGSEGQIMPIVLIERFVTFKEGEERTVAASGHDVRLFAGFHFSLDIGQVVPAKLGGDLRFVVAGDQQWLEPVGKAEMFIVTKHLKEANPAKGARVVIGAKFDPAYFNGTYKLYSDGRCSGKLILKLAANRKEVEGWFYSDKDGAKYEVSGTIGNPKHLVEFAIQFPRTLETFRGMLFTGDGRAIAGTSRLQDREAGFYAVRVEE